MEFPAFIFEPLNSQTFIGRPTPIPQDPSKFPTQYDQLFDGMVAGNTPRLLQGARGYGEIFGVTKKNNVSYRAKVYLLDPKSMVIETYITDADGKFIFKGLPKGKEYIILASDVLQSLSQAVIIDRLKVK